MRKLIFASMMLAGILACSEKADEPQEEGPVNPQEEGTVNPHNPQEEGTVNPLTNEVPQPTVQIARVQLTETEAGYVQAGNALAFNLFNKLGKREKSFVFSPLSMQYALAMTANGASGAALDEIVAALGYGDQGIEALNAYSKKMMEQLPAVDLDVKLQLANGLIVNELYPLDADFRDGVRSNYYAAVENMPFSQPSQVADAVNGWASRNTNGLIDKILEANQISPLAIAYLMNALYFKAEWEREGGAPLFWPEGTRDESFYPGGCSVIAIPMMHTQRWMRYAKMEGFGVLEIPYAGGKFAMYILLPDNVVVGDRPDPDPATENYYTFEHLYQDLPTLDWNDILARLQYTDVILSLPKFETASDFDLNKTLQTLGIETAFKGGLDRMFAPQDGRDVEAAISKVIQKARIAVAEWGTEAAAVTIVELEATSAGPDENQPKPVEFICNHPFAWLIAERTSGAILFEGAFHGI